VKRLAAIGVDAAEWSLVEQLLEAGELPHLAALRSRAAVAQLDDPEDYRTGLVWEHFLTGRGAAANRRWAAVEFDPDTYEVWQEGARPARPFYGGEDAPRSVVFDVPYAPLAHPANGAVVAGWGGHDPGYPRASVPAGLLRQIDERFGPHPACNNDYEIVWYRPDAIDALADALIVGTRRRVDASLWLLEQTPGWELFVTVLSEPHSAGEQLWHGVDPAHPTASAPTAAQAGRRLREVYRAVDDAVGRLVAGLPDDTTLVVFSMHGMSTNLADVASMVLLPELLHRLEGRAPQLRVTVDDAWSRDGSPPLVPSGGWTPHLRRLVGPRPGVPTRAIGRLRGALARRGTAASSAGGFVGALGHPIAAETDLEPADIGVPRSSVAWQIPLLYREWWTSSRAFALPTFYDGRIRLNVRGRERDGVVDPADYVAVIDQLERELQACRDVRTGEPVVAGVDRLRIDEPMAAGGPDADLQVRWAVASDAIEHPRVGRIGPVPFRRTGGHSPAGFAMVAGPGIEPADLGRRAALDVPATILALLDRRIPAEFEGRPLLSPATAP
jgi:predicted AlkP superfamily phosphohydrolase/phosphomutase